MKEIGKVGVLGCVLMVDEVVESDAFFATNTSSLPVVAQAAATRYGRKSGIGLDDYWGAEPVENPGLAA